MFHGFDSLIKIMPRLCRDYAANYDHIDDRQAQSCIKRAFKFDDDNLKLRRSYEPKFEKAIGAEQTAKFYQVDNRLNLLVNVQLASLFADHQIDDEGTMATVGMTRCGVW
jgi:hypothetical protein